MPLTGPVSEGRQRAGFGVGLQIFKEVWGGLAAVWATSLSAPREKDILE